MDLEEKEVNKYEHQYDEHLCKEGWLAKPTRAEGGGMKGGGDKKLALCSEVI